MTDMDELYEDVFQIPLTLPKESPLKRKSNDGLKARKVVKAYEKNIDENSVDIYSDLSLDNTCHHETVASPLKETDTKSDKMSEVCMESIQDNLDLYTDIMTSELTEKEKYKQELKKLQLENERLTVENKKLQHLKEQLSKNISSLFLTAKKELEKKDEEIQKLQQIIEQLKKTNIDNTRDRPKSYVDESQDRPKSYVDESRDIHWHQSQDDENKKSWQKSQDSETRYRQKSHVDETWNRRWPNISETRDKPKSHVDETRDKPKSCVDETRDKPKSCVDETRNKPKSRVDETRDKPKSRVDETRDKPKSRVDETRDKPKSRVDETRDKPKSRFDETRDKPKSHVDETRDKPKSRFDESRDKPKSRFDESRDKPKSHVDETRDKPKSRVDETRDKPKSHVDETRYKPKSHVDETRDKPKSHDDETRDKPKSCVDETRDKPKSRVDETRDKPKSRVDETRDKPKSGVDETRDKPKSRFDETRDKPMSCVDESKDRRWSHINDTREKQKSHVDKIRDEQKSHVDETKGKLNSSTEENRNKQFDEFRIKSKSQVDETKLVKKSEVDEHIEVHTKQKTSDCEEKSTKLQVSLQDKLKSSDSKKDKELTGSSKLSGPSESSASLSLSDAKDKQFSTLLREDDKTSKFNIRNLKSDTFSTDFHSGDLIGKDSHDSEQESKFNLPFASFVTKKSKDKSDDSNESESAKSNNSSHDTDSDKQSRSSEEFSKRNKSSKVESPVPYATSIICTSNLILLGDEETTCTTFVSPSKPHYLPSEFYPPGVRAHVQEVGSHARHIRGTSEVIQKSGATALHLSGNHSSSVTDPPIIPEKNILSKHSSDCGKIDFDEMVMDSVEEEINPLKLKKLQARVESQTVQHLEVLKDNKINSWRSIVEETFHHVFHKELKTFKEYNALHVQGGRKMHTYSQAQILEKKMNLVRRCKQQSRSLKNLQASGKVTCEKSTSSPVSLISYTYSPTGKNTFAKSVETGGLDTLLKLPCDSKIIAKNYNLGSVDMPERQPNSASQVINSICSSSVKSFDNLASAHGRSGHQLQKFDQMKFSEADSTSEYQKNFQASDPRPVTKDYATLVEKLSCADLHSNTPADAHVSSSDDDLQEEEAKENRSGQSSPSVSPYKNSRPNKMCGPLKPRSDSVTRREGSLVNMAGRSTCLEEALNKTFTISPESPDAVYDDDDTVFLNTRDIKRFKVAEPPEEISLMDASLSEFDSDVRKTPNKGGKHLQLDLGSSPVYFRNMINNNCHMHFKNQSPGYSENTLKSPTMNMKNVGKLFELESALGNLSTDLLQTGKITSCTNIPDALPSKAESDLHSESDIVVSSRHRSFQELKQDQLVNSRYVYVEHTSEDDLDQDLHLNDGHHLNEEVIEYIRTVQKVKKKLDLDSSPAMSSPFIQVSDSLTSPPTRQQSLSESRMSALKIPMDTQESLPAYATIESNERVISREDDPLEDVEEGEILDSQEDKLEPQHVPETISRIDKAKPTSDKYIQIEKNNTNSEPLFPKKESMNLEPLVGKDISSRLGPSRRADKPEVCFHRKRSRSKSPQTKRTLKYFRTESGQKLSQERSKSNSLERERRNDSRKNNRERSRSRELDRDKRNLDDRAKFSDRDRNRQHPSSKDSFERKIPRSSSRHERNRLSDEDSGREKRQKETRTLCGASGSDKRRQHGDEACRSKTTNGSSLYKRENSHFSSSNSHISRPQNSKSRRE